MKRHRPLIVVVFVVTSIIVLISGKSFYRMVQHQSERVGGNVPIIFYGRIVDQYGNGVAGADVSGVVESYAGIYVPGSGDISKTERTVATKTDLNGFFKLDAGAGVSLGLTADAPGYIGDCGDAYLYSTAIPSVKNPYRSDPQYPVVIKYWKFQGTTHLPQHHLRLQMKGDGRAYTIDLPKQSYHEGDDGAGDLRVAISSSTTPAHDGSPSWKFDASAVNGGFVRASDQKNDFVAPPSGYISAMSFEIGDRTVRQSLYGTKYYLKSRDGSVYATLLMYPDVHHNPILDIDYRVTTGGSRLLEP